MVLNPFALTVSISSCVTLGLPQLVSPYPVESSELPMFQPMDMFSVMSSAAIVPSAEPVAGKNAMPESSITAAVPAANHLRA